MSTVATAAAEISVLIVDDHELMRAGMIRLLEDMGFRLRFREAGTAEAAIQILKHEQFNVVFLDLKLPGISGVEAAMSWLRQHRDLKIIIMTAASEITFTRQLLQTGVQGYLTKDCNPGQMERAMREVLADKIYIEPNISRMLEQSAKQTAATKPQASDNDIETLRLWFAGLSNRESQIVFMLVRGRSNRQIASELYISEKTVSSHKTSACRKVGAASLAELSIMANRVGLLEQLSPASDRLR